MAHTPGPWEARPNDGQIILNGSNAYDIREIYNDQGGFNPDDIRLMAMAPGLLVALRVAHDALDYAQAQVDSEADAYRLRKWRVEIGRAIAKAEGRADDQ